MPRAAFLLAVLALGVFSSACVAADETGRATPSRPGGKTTTAGTVNAWKLPGVKIGGVDYVSVNAVAKHLGLKVTPGANSRSLTLADKNGRAELEADSRDTMINGLRVWLGDPVALRGEEFFVSRTDVECCLGPRLRPALNGVKLTRPKVVAIDPGHGGGDPGMENQPLGLQEKALTLDVALRLEKLLKAEGFTVVLTRRDDRQLAADKATDWRKRGEIANAAHADLFVSIHFNSLFPDTKTSGTEVYAFTPEGQRSTRAWSPTQANDAEDEPARVNQFDAWNAVLAQAMHRAVLTNLKTSDRGQKTMHSAVLRGLRCPGVLVEAVFLSNDGEGRKSGTPEYRQQIAAALAAGVRGYAALFDPPGAK